MSGTGRIRPAFSLAELVISIGILILMMALAGQVFTITVQSTGQATALTEISQELRMFEDALREDLRGVQPGQSLVLIQGNPVNAYWTQSQKEADALVDGNPETGYAHVSDPERENAKGELFHPRADILMFFTSGKATSYVSPNITGRLQQVVYGHAELGEYEPDSTSGPGGNPYTFRPDFTTPAGRVRSAFPVDATTGYPLAPSQSPASPVPSSQWHLARRSVMLAPTPAPPAPLLSASQRLTWAADLFVANRKGLGERALVESGTDVVWSFPYEQLVLGWTDVAPWRLPRIFYDPQGNRVVPYARSWLDPTPPPVYANRLGAYFLPNCASFKVEWSLDPKSPFVAGRLDGISEVFWFDPGDVGDPADLPANDPLRSLKDGITRLGDAITAATDPSKRGALEAQRMNLQSLLCDQTQHADGTKYSLADRFRGVSCTGNQYDPNLAWDQLAPDVRRPNLEVFTATRPTAIGSDAPDDVWPGALRITIDVFDRERRVERPIRHIMVVPIGR